MLSKWKKKMIAQFYVVKFPLWESTLAIFVHLWSINSAGEKSKLTNVGEASHIGERCLIEKISGKLNAETVRLKNNNYCSQSIQSNNHSSVSWLCPLHGQKKIKSAHMLLRWNNFIINSVRYSLWYSIVCSGPVHMFMSLKPQYFFGFQLITLSQFSLHHVSYFVTR